MPTERISIIKVGTDANASLLRDALSDAGVHLDHLKEIDGPTGTAVILVQPSGAFPISHKLDMMITLLILFIPSHSDKLHVLGDESRMCRQVRTALSLSGAPTQ